MDLDKIADRLLQQRPSSPSPRFKNLLIEYLKESYGLRVASVQPDVDCYVNATSRTYRIPSEFADEGNLNQICGSIQLAPGRTGLKQGKKVTIEKVPECYSVLDFSRTRILMDSLAFTDVLTGSRVTPEQALDRQVRVFDLLLKGQKPIKSLLVSYDRLIDEKFVDGRRIKQRWGVEEAWEAVGQTVDAAKYLNSQRDRLGEHILIQSCQGVDAAQYYECVEQVLPFCASTDILGLGGWCILGREKKYLPIFFETMDRVIPLIAKAGIHRVHIFGVTWFRPMPGFPVPPLVYLLGLCDHHGIALQTDGTSPIGNALWKDWRRAGATFAYWRHNLAWVKAELATLRDSEAYQELWNPTFVQLSLFG